ncbi:hypothetical protein MW871_11295 [Flavobacterium sp. I-SCBP12n]|uniref:Uncharacterized protein n=1 Tax=Flavobacterium pygoscelis TaxID=2893176 RepID=A0A9X2BLX8_9FLAO|nr:hypothetical protein [Flavobacterium pygoscelis]MCK8142477.1 hypothetical protein [Flavobacterium pygoscelis]
MIDNIKIMNLDFNPEFILNNYKWKVVNFDHDEISELNFKKGWQTNITNKSRMFSLRMLLTENLKAKTYTLSINGSIRKWYFDKNSRKDLNYFEFVDCIEILGGKLGLKKGEIWTKFKVTKLEIGITLLLKSFNNDILNCFVKYRNAERDDKNCTTVYFKFNNYILKIYDKYLEIMQKQQTDLNKNIINKFLFFRFEISIKKISGTSFNKNYNELSLLKSNWNMFPNELKKYLGNIKFVDTISKEKTITEKISYNDFIKWKIYSEMKSNGIYRTIMDFNEKVLPNNKSKYFNDLMDNYKSFVASEKDYKAIILLELEKKTNRLYNKGNIRYIAI